MIRRLWTAEEITHEGRYYSMQEVRIHPPPAQAGGPPIVVAGRQEAAMRRAATLGDGWFPYLYSPRRYAASVETIKEVATEAGRDLSTFEWYVFVFVNVNPDGDTARAGRAIDGWHLQPGLRSMVDSVAAAGTVEEVTAKLRAFHDSGCSPLRLQSRHRRCRPPTVIDRLLGDTVPALREHAAAAR